MKIDEKNEIILQMLMENARTKIKEIAKKCQITPSAVLKRITKMQNEGLIRKKILFLNYTAFGYKFPSMIGIKMNKDQEEEVSSIIRENVQTVAIDNTIGKYDLCVFILAKDLNEIEKIKNVIKAQNGIKNIDLNIFNRMFFPQNIEFLTF